MRKPLYVLRARREYASDALVEALKDFVNEDDLRQHIDTICACGDEAWKSERWLVSRVQALRGRIRHADVSDLHDEFRDAVDAVFNEERLEVFELTVAGGHFA